MKHIIVLFFFSFGVIYSQNDSINKLDEIILHGNFSPVVNSGYKVQVIADSLLNDSYQSLGNLLQKQANFYFKQNGNGMVSSISLRGTSASQTGVYWNGIAINSSLNGQTDFNSLQANGFDEVELRKGGGSVLLGNGSIGGAINLKDKLIFEKKQGIQLLTGAGSYETYFAQIKGIWSTEEFYAKISGGVQSSENDYPYLGTDLKNENAAFNNFNVNATLGYRINDFHHVRLNASVFSNDRNLSRTLSTQSNSKLENMDRRFLVDWNYLADRFSSSLKVAMLHEDFSYFADRDIPANLSYGESDRLVAKYDITYFLNNDLFFRSGAEYEHAKGEGTSITNVSRDDFSAYALMHHQPLKSLLYNVSIRAGGSSAYSIPFIYSVDAKYLPHKNWSIRGAYSTNYRLPTFNDLYWEPGGNPDLKPEFSRSAELGLDYKHTFFTISGGWYVIHSEDLIQWRPVTSDFWQPQNISEASNNGIELMFDIQRNFGDHKLHLNASYDYTLASDKEIDKQLIYVPKNRAGANLDYRWHSWKINYNLQYVGKVFITTSNSQSLDDYLLSDMALSRSFFMNHMDASFRVNNVFNVSYQSVSYRPMPGRNFVFQLNFKL